MKLEVDKSHKRIDLSKLKEPLKRVTVGILGTTISISIFGTTIPVKAYADDTPPAYTQTVDTEEVDIPEECRFEIAWKVGKTSSDPITKEDLAQIEYLFLAIDNEDTDLSFLQYCTNLNMLSIYIKTDNLDFLKTLPSLPKVETFSLSSVLEPHDFGREDMECLDKLPSIKSFMIDGLTIAPGCEERLNQLEELDIGFITNCDIDFTKLTNLKQLTVKNIEPYDLAVFLNSEEYETLRQNGVEIVFENEWQKETYLRSSETIDEIIANLGVDKNSTDEEKLNAILIYVLETLTYNPEVSEATRKGEEHQKLTESFYEGGALYGALEKDTCICGNYAALVEALMDRLDVSENSTILHSDNHAWNLILIDGEPYYVDATWLDGLTVSEGTEHQIYEDGHLVGIEITFESKKAEDYLRKGDTTLLQWYMENPDPEYIATIDEYSSHVPEFVPGYMSLENHAVMAPEVTAEAPTPTVVTEQPQAETENVPVQEDVTHEKVRIKIGKKEIIITVGALVGVMGALGAAIAVKKKKERERRRRWQQQRSYDPFGSTYDDPFGSSYDDDSYSSSYYNGRGY